MENSASSTGPDSNKPLRRGLRAFALFGTMLVLHGAAPYGTEEVIPKAGPGLALLVLGLMALFWGLPYVLIVAELVSSIPEEGGMYRWFRKGLGPFWSFMFACSDWLTWILDSALYPPLVAAYFVTFFVPSPSHEFTWIIGLVMIWGCAWVNIRGITAVGKLSLLIGGIVLAPMLAIMFLGLPRVGLASFGPWVPPDQPFVVSLNFALIMGMWHYSGYYALASASEEIVDAERNYPKVLGIFLPINVVLFLLPLIAGLGAVPDWASWETAHFSQVALVLGGTFLAGFLAFGAQLGAVGIFNGQVLVASRLAFAMARDRLLPPVLARLHPRHGTPHLFLIAQAVIYSVLTYFFDFSEILIISIWMTLSSLLLLFSMPIILRLKHPEIRGRFRIPGGWPGVILTCLLPSSIAVLTLFTTEMQYVKVGLAFLAVGPVLYFLSPMWGREKAGGGSA